jgi:hypothetical protein
MLSDPKKLVLCASNSNLIAGLWMGAKLQSYTVFSNDDEGYTKFAQYLSNHTQTNTYLIADAIEEDYRLEGLPHTSGNARRELIERKLNQFNRTSVYRTAHFIKRATDKRKDDYFLFIALSNTDFLQPWMNAIQSNQSPLVGVYLLPMISQVMVRQMKLMSPNILLCERLSSGLRQTYLHNGRLRLSRLTPTTDVKPNQLAYFYLVETEKTRLYLMSQRLITSETPLQMVLPALDDIEHQIATNISQDQGIECKTVDVLAYAKNSHISPDVVKKYPALLHMQLLVNGHVPDNLAPATFTKSHHLAKVRRAIYVASVAVLAMGLACAGYFWWQGYAFKEELARLTLQTQQQERLYQDVARNFPATPIPGADLKMAAEIAQAVNQNRHTPRTLMQVLSRSLEQSPEVNITRMHWLLTEDREVKDEDANDAAAGTSQAAPRTNTGAAYSGAVNSALLYQVGFINGEVSGFTGDYRAALATVSRFVTNLRNHSAVEQVVMLQEPVNVSSLASLKGSTTDENNTQTTPAIFKIKVILKQGPATQLVQSEVTR